MSFCYVNKIRKISENRYALEIMDSSISPKIPENVEVDITRDGLVNQFIMGNLHDNGGKWLKTKNSINKFLKEFEV